MGLHKYNSDKGPDYNTWTKITHKYREEHKCACQLPENAGKFCIFHGWALSGTFYRGNIKSSPAADELIRSRSIPRDENGNELPSTERGRRRRAKRRGE